MSASNRSMLSLSSIYAFMASIISGYLVHLYAFTNLIPNSDGIGRMYDIQNMLVSGRWFLHIASIPHGFMQLPSYIAGLTLFFMGFSAILLVDLLEIKNKYLALVLGISLVSFPSLGFTFLYLFTASAYSIGIFLAIFSVWLHEKGGLKFSLLAILVLSLSMGIYQAYAPFAISLSLILVIKKTILSADSMKSVTLYGIRKLLFLALGAMLYYLILQALLFFSQQELLPYLGMENSQYPLSNLPSLIVSAYKQVILFFFRSGTGTSSVPLAIFHTAFFLLGCIALFYLLRPLYISKSSRWRCVFVVLLCSIAPLALGFVQIISPWSVPSPLMQYPYVLAYVLVFFFFDQCKLPATSSWSKKFLPTTYVITLLISLSSAWLCNLLYSSSHQAHKATESYATRMLSRIESVAGYQWDMPVLIIGSFPSQRFYSTIPAYSLIDHYSVDHHSVLPLNKHIYYYFQDWLNVPISEPSESMMISMSNSTAFAEMPCYPDDGSVTIIDGKVVVKVGEEYQPKSDYELAYENRK